MNKILLLIVFSVLFLFACKHEPESPSEGPEIPQAGCKLQKKILKNSNQSYTYEYDSEGRISKYTELWNDVPRTWNVFHYSGKRMVSRESWSDYPNSTLKMERLDTLIYNDKGLISEKRVLIPKDNLSVKTIYQYVYNSDGLPVESRVVDAVANETILSHKYFWENGNIAGKEDYAGDFGDLMHEWVYEYGTGLNPEKIVAMYPEHPDYQSENLEKAMNATDYTGLLDLLCNPCFHNYDLNEQDLPTRIHYGWGKEIELIWDCP